MKCLDCGSYNTVREKGPLVRREGGGAVGTAVASGAEDEEVEEEEDEEDEEEEEEEEDEVEEEEEELVEGPEVMDLTAGLSVLTPPETPTRPEQMMTMMMTRGGSSAQDHDASGNDWHEMILPSVFG